MITMMDGPFLEADCKILAHPVSYTGSMRMAEELHSRYPGSCNIYKTVCEAANAIGNASNLLGINLGCCVEDKIIIHMFVLKEDEVSYHAVHECLRDLLRIAENQQLYEVAMPYAIYMYPLIEEIFGSSLVNVKLYCMEDSANDNR